MKRIPGVLPIKEQEKLPPVKDSKTSDFNYRKITPKEEAELLDWQYRNTN